jgi:putative DNA primase/helicase
MLKKILSEDATSVAQPQHSANGAQLNGNGNHPDPQGKDAKSRAKANAQDVFNTTGEVPTVPRGITSQTHKTKLRMIAEDVIEERGYATVTDSFALENINFPASCNPALLIPGHKVHDVLGGYQIRLDVPFADKAKPGKKVRYLFAKEHQNFLDCLPRHRPQLGNPKIPLYITESIIKADTLTSQGLCALAISGVTGWKGKNEDGGTVALPCFDSIAIKDRVIYVVPDSDYKTNRNVRAAVNKLAAWLKWRGATVKVIEIPAAPDGSKQGADDYFDADGNLIEFHSFAEVPGKSNSKVGKADAESADLEAGPSEFPLNEIGNGARFANEHAGALRFSSTDERWRFYENGIWQEDNHGEAERRAKQTAKKFAADAAQETDDDKRGRLLKHAVTLTKRSVRETMLKDAASEPGMAATLEDFDVNLDLFNCSNGTLNLLTREFWQHSPKDLLTRKSPVRYDAEATCPVWRRCIERWITDAETREFIQEIVGVTLSGRVYEEFFMFLYGEGNNGKSRFLGIVEFLLGTYFHKTKAETVMQSRQKRNASAPAQEILELKGARGVGTHEIDEKQEVSTTLIKDLTGRDSITARGVYAKRETTFSPQFTLWMFGNGKPLINDPSGGMWRRPKLINFGAPIPVSERDPQLTEKLKCEASGILNWALEGLARVEARGGVILTPEAVEGATKCYRESQDPLASFLEEVCYIGPEHSAASSEIFEAWSKWSKDNGYEVGNPHTLFTALGRGSAFKVCKVSRRGKQVRGWRGISIFSLNSHGQNAPESGEI